MHQVRTHRNSIEAHCLFDRIGKVVAKDVCVEGVAVDVCHVCAQHKGWLLFAGNSLKDSRLSKRQLHCIRVSANQRRNDRVHIFDA